MVYNVSGKNYDYFESYVGLDTETGASSDGAIFKVLVDNKEVYDSGVVKPGERARNIKVDIKDASKVTLKTLKGAHDWEDHTDWANAMFTYEVKVLDEELVTLIESAKEIYKHSLKAALEKFEGMRITESTGDINGNGKFEIGDLAIVSKHYGKNSIDSSEQWETIGKYDLNKDGKIDGYELDFISHKTLN